MYVKKLFVYLCDVTDMSVGILMVFMEGMFFGQ